jgi:hypothetical protein
MKSSSGSQEPVIVVIRGAHHSNDRAAGFHQCDEARAVLLL